MWLVLMAFLVAGVAILASVLLWHRDLRLLPRRPIPADGAVVSSRRHFSATAPGTLFLKGQYEAVPGRPPINTGAFGSVQISRLKASRNGLLRALCGEPDTAYVAIKYLRYSDDTERNLEMNRALEKEIQALTRCNHPNILRIFGLWCDPVTTQLGIVSQFSDEGALVTYLKKKTPGFLLATQILRDVAAGLEYLHELPMGENQCGLAHGDLHPGNVLINNDGPGIRAVLSDFGLCKIVDENGMTSSSLRANGIAGLPAYIGPEVYREGDLGDLSLKVPQSLPKYAGHRTIKADIFAFGMLSFTTLGGDLKAALCKGNDTMLAMPIAISIVKGIRPKREHLHLKPDKNVAPAAIDEYWSAIEACWQADAAKRPAIETVRDKIPTAVAD